MRVFAARGLACAGQTRGGRKAVFRPIALEIACRQALLAIQTRRHTPGQLAERVGFEPTGGSPPGGFQDRCNLLITYDL